MTFTIQVDPEHAERVREQLLEIEHAELVEAETDLDAEGYDLRANIVEAAEYLREIRAGRAVGRPIQDVLDEL